MAEVKNIYKTFFEKKVASLLKNSRHKEKEKIVYYLKLYTNLLRAEFTLSTRRGFDHLKVAINMTKEASYQGETHYLDYISSLAREIISAQKKIQSGLRKDPVSDPAYAKTKLLIAQNICIMRIMKISLA